VEQGSFSFVDNLVASAAFSAVLCGALGFAWRTYRQRYLGYWALYWGLYTLVWPGAAVLQSSPAEVGSNPLLFALNAGTILAGFAARAALVLGVLDYLGDRPLSRRGLQAVGAAVLLLTAGNALAHLGASHEIIPAWVARPFRGFSVGVVLFAVMTAVVLKSSIGHPHPAPRRLLAAALLANGLGDLWDLILDVHAGSVGWIPPSLNLRLSALATHASDALAAVAMMVVAMGAEWQRAETAAAELRRGESRLRSLFENALDIIAVLDPHGALRYTSPSAERILGYERESLAGRNLFDLVHPDDRGGCTAALRAAEAAPESPSLLEARVRRADGQWLWMDVALQLRELTEKRALEARLRQAQRLETIGQLAGGVAHDFNNLLTAVLANLSILDAEMPPGGHGREEVRDATLAAERATRLTRQLLTFARQQVVAPRRVDLNESVEAMDRLLGRLIGEHIARQTRLAPGLWPVRIDPSQLEQVLVNLVVNARDAMPGGGTLTVLTANVVLAPGERSPEAVDVPPGEWVRLIVEDTGVGMDEATLSRIFEPFFTTKDKGRGTGLGLATVHGTVRQAAGHVRVQSAPGAGTRFTVWLPRDPGGPEPMRAPAPAPPQGGHETLLLVEDDPQVRAIAARVLSARGYRVLQAADGLEALRAAEAHPGAISLLVTDVVMPGLGGRGLADTLRERRPELPVLFLSGYPEGGLETGASFLQKPFTPDQLAAAVRQLLDAGRAAARPVARA
jgi:PAS domain S-box-containing protein